MNSRLKKLLDTTAVRLSLKYSLIYIAIFGAAFLFLYWFISSFVQDQIKVNLIQESRKIETIYNKQGFDAVKKYINLHQQYKGEDHKYYLLVNKHGKIIAGDLKRWPSSLKIDNNIHNIWIAEDDIKGKIEDGDGYWPMKAFEFKDGSKMLIAQGIKGTEDLRETMFTIMASMFGFIVILTVILGLSLGKKVLWHIESINSAYKNVMGGDLSSRISISSRNDEFDAVAEQLNEMLDKIENLINESHQTINNVAHDLRTPLNRIRNRIEISLMENNTNDYSDVLEKTMEDIDDVVNTFNSILQISQAESKAARKYWENINLKEIVLDIIDLYSPLMEENSINFKKQIEDVIVKGNKHLITQAISNILDNAVKYTPKNGAITVLLKKEQNTAVVSICDSGPGVKEKDYKKIVKRFIRLDNSRHTPGNGLGLSLVKAVVGLHAAKLRFRDNKPGLCVKIEFVNPVLF